MTLHDAALKNANLQSTDWKAIAASPAFKQLQQQRLRWQLTLLAIALPYFFLLPVATAYFPHWLAQRVLGVINVGLLFALSQFVLAWGVAWIYVRVANRRFDQQAQAIIAEVLRQAVEARQDSI